jgi:branched-chain amino acid transport system permease protein
VAGLAGWYSAQSALLDLLGINVLLTLSVSIGLSRGVLSLANAAFMGIGADAVMLMTPDVNWPLWAVLPAGALLAMLVAVPLGLPVLRMRSVYLAVVTLGFGDVFGTLMRNAPVTRGTIDLASGANRTTWWQIGLAILAVCYLFWHIDRSRLGHAFAVIRQDELLAGSLGINVAAHKLVAFVLGACIAGLAGGLAGHLTPGATLTDFGVGRGEMILFAAVIGGPGVFWGALPGAALVTLASAWLGAPPALQTGAGGGSFGLNEILLGALALLAVVFFPGGISGARLRRRHHREGRGDRPEHGASASGGPPTLQPIIAAPEEG